MDNGGEPERVARIKVIGVGGGGSNAVSRMFKDRIPGVEYIAINTDVQALMRSDVPVRVQIGRKLTRGLGVGGDPELGREAAEESRDDLHELVKESDMVFIAAGMGGGTGTGAAPVLAELARGAGGLTIGVVTKPFSFEGSKRRKQAEEGIQRLTNKVDALITIPNDRLLSLSERALTVDSAFRLADDVLRQGIQAIAELVTTPGEINLDFADVKAVMQMAGQAWMSIGRARGENRAIEAARAAIQSPLLEVSIEGAKGIILNVAGGDDLTLSEVHAAADMIAKVADPDANIIFGMVYDSKLGNEVKITVIATGFPPMQETTSLIKEGKVASALPMTDADLDIPPFLRRQVPKHRY